MQAYGITLWDGNPNDFYYTCQRMTHLGLLEVHGTDDNNRKTYVLSSEGEKFLNALYPHYLEALNGTPQP